MAKQYEMNGFRRAANAFVSWLARRGRGPAFELVTIGRRSHEPRTVPVTPVEVDGDRYLVSPYGDVGWVHNIRASGTATLRRGGQAESITVTEVGPEEAGRVLAVYHAQVGKIVHPYFDVPAVPTVEDFVAEAAAHPVFRIEQVVT